MRAYAATWQDYEEDDPKTHKYDLHKMTMTELYTKFGLEPNTVDFVGHSLALHRNDNYLHQPALPTARPATSRRPRAIPRRARTGPLGPCCAARRIALSDLC